MVGGVARKGAFALLLVISQSAFATHFWGGSVRYQLGASTATTQDVTFYVESQWRESFYPGTLAVGSTLDLGQNFAFGDGGSTSLVANIVAVDPAMDRFLGESIISHTYSIGSTPYTAMMSSCCRSSVFLNGNGDQSYILKTDVATAPGSAASPSVFDNQFTYDLLEGVSAGVQLGTGPDSGNVSFVYTAPADSGLVSFNTPQFSLGSDGLLTYNGDAAALGYYAFQVRAMDTATGLWTVKDFNVNLVSSCDAGCYQAPAPVPEPKAYLLFGLALLGLVGIIRYRKPAEAGPGESM